MTFEAITNKAKIEEIKEGLKETAVNKDYLDNFRKNYDSEIAPLNGIYGEVKELRKKEIDVIMDVLDSDAMHEIIESTVEDMTNDLISEILKDIGIDIENGNYSDETIDKVVDWVLGEVGLEIIDTVVEAVSQSIVPALKTIFPDSEILNNPEKHPAEIKAIQEKAAMITFEMFIDIDSDTEGDYSYLKNAPLESLNAAIAGGDWHEVADATAEDLRNLGSDIKDFFELAKNGLKSTISGIFHKPSETAETEEQTEAE